MWQVIKSYGYTSNVTLVNEEEGKEIILGVISIKMLDILKENDIDTGNTKDPWSFEVTKEIAQALAGLVTIAEKPIRAKLDKKAKAKEVNKNIDAMDVLLGLANYS